MIVQRKGEPMLLDHLAAVANQVKGRKAVAYFMHTGPGGIWVEPSTGAQSMLDRLRKWWNRPSYADIAKELATTRETGAELSESNRTLRLSNGILVSQKDNLLDENNELRWRISELEARLEGDDQPDEDDDDEICPCCDCEIDSFGECCCEEDECCPACGDIYCDGFCEEDD
jgi:hypothetical protein